MHIIALKNKTVEDGNTEVLIPRPGFFSRNIDAVNLAIAFAFAYSTAYATLGSINSSFATVISLGSYVFIALVINALPSILRSFTKSELLLAFLFFIVYIISYASAIDTEVHMLVLSGMIRFCIPLFLLGISVRNPEDLYAKLRKSSVFILFCIVFTIFISQTNQLARFSYSQDTGYEALLPFMVFLAGVIINHNKWDWIGVAISATIILMSGARGPFFCAAVGVIIFILVGNRYSMRKTISMLFVMVAAAAVIYIFYVSILEALIQTFGRWNVSTRILYGLLNSNIIEDNTRSSLRQYAWEYIQSHVFWGSGLVNDRRLIYDNFAASVATAYGTYVHNFFLETMMQLGMIPGVCVSGLYVAWIIRSLIRTNEKYMTKILVTFVITGFVPLMVSRSYVSFSNFYLLTGMLFANSVITTGYFKEGNENG